MKTILVFLLSLSTCTILFGQESVYPEGFNITVTGGLSSSSFMVDDTVTVTRTISNGESFELANLYLADMLPNEFELLSYDLYLSSQPVNHFYSGALRNQIINGYTTFRWVIDQPYPDDQLNIIVPPGGILQLTYYFTCPDPGSYILPFHSFVFEGGQSGFFSLNVPESVTVEQSFDYGSLSGIVRNIDMLPIQGVRIQLGQGLLDYTDSNGFYLITQITPGLYDVGLYHPTYGDSLITGVMVQPGPATSLDIVWNEPPVEYTYLPGDINGDGQLIGSDITYGVNYFRGAGNPPPDSMWNPAAGEWHYAAADGNGDCSFIGSDITYLMAYFRAIHDFIEWCSDTPPY